VYGEHSYEYLEAQRMVVAEEKKLHEEAVSNAQKAAIAKMEALAQMVNNLNTIFDNIAQIMKNSGKESKRFANVQKALALASIAMDTAVAIMKVMAQPGPLSLKITQAALVGAMGITQAGVVISAQNKSPIPSAETGNTFEIPEMSTHRSDGQLIKVNPGERATISPRSSGDDRNTTLQMILNDEILWENTQRGIDSGRLTFTQANMVGAY